MFVEPDSFARSIELKLVLVEPDLLGIHDDFDSGD